MYPGFFMRWRARGEHAHAGCHAGSGHGPRGHGHGGAWGFGGGQDGGGFGVRRPLRFLVHKLDLDEKQSAKLVKILDELKTERAQAAVDDRRSVAGFADAISKEAYDDSAAAEAGKRRIETAERLSRAVDKALREIHELLDAEQRDTLAYLIRSGTLGI
jgi:Spy/CpxP family protein refolding chaperone